MHKFITFTCIAIILVLFSCTSQKQITYLQDASINGAENFDIDTITPYKIKRQDVLYIKMVTSNSEINNILNPNASSPGMYQGESNLFINGFVVDEKGNIELPLIGKVHVENCTLDNARDNIREKALVYLKDPTIYVKMLSYKYTVLGEVRRPGMYKNFNNRLNVLEAISSAGDISEFGNRKKIVVIRLTKNGSKTFRLDLTKKEILTSDAYYLKPNDIVYVEPLKSKSFKLNIPVASLMLTSISTLILILNFIK
ncbi:MAG: polysaccharide biosynthesis/export family protein [Bacteroidales bacterium]|jgi:polysaccharide export outer membrane protein|nr:polysaccharide biosynthesis/export family protein [Bacteroidales bacterium]